jgi:hypothetical protein
VATDSYVAASGDWCDGGTRAIATAGAMLPAGCYYKREVPTWVLPLSLHATDLIWLDGALRLRFESLGLRSLVNGKICPRPLMV